MKQRIAITALCISAATLSAAIDLYEVRGLEDHGLGSRSRHIASWSPTLAAAVGDVKTSAGDNQAAIWPDISPSGGGPLVELPTPNSLGNSTAASYTRLDDGRYLVVGQWTDEGGVPRASAWINSLGMPWTYMGSALPDTFDSTGSEALDVASLPNGGAVISGTTWPLAKWIGCVWFVSPSGTVNGPIALQSPPGTGWSYAQSCIYSANPGGGLLGIVGRIQETEGGPWRACAWRVNLATGQQAFRMLNGGQAEESYGYRIDPAGRLAIGWIESGGLDYATAWRLPQGNQRRTLDRESRFYGANSLGYLVGWQVVEGSRVGLVAHTDSLGGGNEILWQFRHLLADPGTFSDYYHLLCNSEHNFVTGCGMQSDYPGGSDKMRALVGVPTGVHGPDTFDVGRGLQIGGSPESLLLVDNNSLSLRAQGRRIILDTEFNSFSAGQDTRMDSQIKIEIGAAGVVGGSVQVYHWLQRRYVESGWEFSASSSNETHTHSWATFPSSWRNPVTGQVRFRLHFNTPGNQTIVGIDAFTADDDPDH